MTEVAKVTESGEKTRNRLKTRLKKTSINDTFSSFWTLSTALMTLLFTLGTAVENVIGGERSFSGYREEEGQKVPKVSFYHFNH